MSTQHMADSPVDEFAETPDQQVEELGLVKLLIIAVSESEEEAGYMYLGLSQQGQIYRLLWTKDKTGYYWPPSLAQLARGRVYAFQVIRSSRYVKTPYPLRTEDLYVSSYIRRVDTLGDMDHFKSLDSVACDLQDIPWRNLEGTPYFYVGVRCPSVAVVRCGEGDLSIYQDLEGTDLLRFSGLQCGFPIMARRVEWPSELGTRRAYVTLQLDRPVSVPGDPDQRCSFVVADISIDAESEDGSVSDEASDPSLLASQGSPTWDVFGFASQTTSGSVLLQLEVKGPDQQLDQVVTTR